MNPDELRQKLELRGYEVKSIRTFQNSFHLSVWTAEVKLRYFYKVPLEPLSWDKIENDFPRVRKP